MVAWESGTRCKGGAIVLRCCSYLVQLLLFVDSILTCACFHYYKHVAAVHNLLILPVLRNFWGSVHLSQRVIHIFYFVSVQYSFCPGSQYDCLRIICICPETFSIFQPCQVIIISAPRDLCSFPHLLHLDSQLNGTWCPPATLRACLSPWIANQMDIVPSDTINRIKALCVIKQLLLFTEIAIDNLRN